MCPCRDSASTADVVAIGFYRKALGIPPRGQELCQPSNCGHEKVVLRRFFKSVSSQRPENISAVGSLDLDYQQPQRQLNSCSETVAPSFAFKAGLPVLSRAASQLSRARACVLCLAAPHA